MNPPIRAVTDTILVRMMALIEKGVTPKYVVVGKKQFEALWFEHQQSAIQSFEDMLAGKLQVELKFDKKDLLSYGTFAEAGSGVQDTTFLSMRVVMTEFYDGVQVLPDAMVHYKMTETPTKL